MNKDFFCPNCGNAHDASIYCPPRSDVFHPRDNDGVDAIREELAAYKAIAVRLYKTLRWLVEENDDGNECFLVEREALSAYEELQRKEPRP